MASSPMVPETTMKGRLTSFSFTIASAAGALKCGIR